MALNDVYHLKAVFSDGVTGKEISTSVNVRQNDPLAPDISALGPDFVDWWNVDLAGAGSAVRNFIPNEIGLQRIELRRIFPLEAVIAVYSTGLPIFGVDLADNQVPSTVILAALRTGSVGARYRGRMRLPRPSDDHVDTSGSLVAADALLIANQTMTFLNTLVVDRGTPIVWSPEDLTYVKKNGDPAPRVGNIRTDVTEVRVDKFLRVFRKRQLRRPSYTADTV